MEIIREKWGEIGRNRVKWGQIQTQWRQIGTKYGLWGKI